MAKICILSTMVLMGAAFALTGCSGSSSGGGTSTTSGNPVPSISAISVSSAVSGSPAVTLTITGSNFIPNSQATYNNISITTTFVSPTAVTAIIPAVDLIAPGFLPMTVINPFPGGGTSNALSFAVMAQPTPLAVTILANDLEWDAPHQQIYLSLPSTASSNANAIQTLNPTTGALGGAVAAGSNPNLLAVSANAEYLYAGLDGSATVQRYLLPGLTKDIGIPLGNYYNGSGYMAMDLQPSPVSDGTVAVMRGAPGSPEEVGGVEIYDDGTMRPISLCGQTVSSTCSGTYLYLYGSIQWNPTATEMFALDNQDTSFKFYSAPVTLNGFGTITDDGSLPISFRDKLHYDAPTSLLYTDSGLVINPATGTTAGNFGVSASAVLGIPDGKLGYMFFLSPAAGTTMYTNPVTYVLSWYDIKHYNEVGSIQIPKVNGTPTHLIRWGANGLAFSTTGCVVTAPCAVYIVNPIL